LGKQPEMLQLTTVAIRNKKVLKILEDLEEQNLLQIVSESQMKLSPAKKKQAVAFLKSYRDAQLAVAGKLKLKSLDELLNEL
jgi:predicted transcriptional regulator